MIVLGTKDYRYDTFRTRRMKGSNMHNGAHYYAKEIEDIILPNFKELSLFIVTAGGTLYDEREIPNDALFVCHHNQNPEEVYGKFFGKNIVWICSKESTVEKIEACGENAVYIPLSIDTKYVKTFQAEKTEDIAFVGNSWGFKADYLASLPEHVYQLTGMKRQHLLKEMAKYKRVIAEGRCYMEALALGCKVEIPEYNDPSIGAIHRELLDTRDTISLWGDVLSNNEVASVLKTHQRFSDMHAGVTRRTGDIFTTTKERARELIEHKLNLVEQL